MGFCRLFWPSAPHKIRPRWLDTLSLVKCHYLNSSLEATWPRFDKWVMCWRTPWSPLQHSWRLQRACTTSCYVFIFLFYYFAFYIFILATQVHINHIFSINPFTLTFFISVNHFYSSNPFTFTQLSIFYFLYFFNHDLPYVTVSQLCFCFLFLQLSHHVTYQWIMSNVINYVFCFCFLFIFFVIRSSTSKLSECNPNYPTQLAPVKSDCLVLSHLDQLSLIWI